MATRTARSVDRTVEKMLRQMAHSPKASAHASASSSTAAQALAQMAEIQKRIARGDTDAAQFLIAKASQSGVPEASGDTRQAQLQALKAQAAQKAAPRAGILAAIGAGAATFLVAGVFAIFSHVGGHSVSGTVMLDQKPLAKVELTFHPKFGDGEPLRITTCERGTFRIESLPPGNYSIFVSPRDLHVKVPKKYLAPETTPFTLKLTKDRSNLRMLAESTPE